MPRMIDQRLGQELLGVWDFAWSLVHYFEFIQMGLTSSVNRYVAKYRAVGDMDTAEDLRQELFVRVYVRGRTYRGESSFSAWLYGIAVNLIRAHFKEAKKLVSTLNAGDCQQPGPAETLGSAARADAVATRNERKRRVCEMLASLSPRHREVLILRFSGGLSFGEISRALGIAEATARVHAHNGIRQLRRLVVERGLSASDLL